MLRNRAFYFIYFITLITANMFVFSILERDIAILTACLMLICSICHLFAGIHAQARFSGYFHTVIAYLVTAGVMTYISPTLLTPFILAYTVFCISYTVKEVFNNMTLFSAGIILGSLILIIPTIYYHHFDMRDLTFDLVFALGFTKLTHFLFFKYMVHVTSCIESFKEYLIPMKTPMFAFFLSYLIIAVICTFTNVSLYYYDPSQFEIIGPTDPPYLLIASMFCYSIQTLGINNYNIIAPAAPAAEFLITFFSLTGSVWLVVILAAVLGYLQDEFDEINAKKKKKRNTN